MCRWCDDIKNLNDYCEMNPYDRNDCIVKDSQGQHYLWKECEDWYYSGVYIELNYCPICGRKLK